MILYINFLNNKEKIIFCHDKKDTAQKTLQPIPTVFNRADATFSQMRT